VRAPAEAADKDRGWAGLLMLAPQTLHSVYSYTHLAACVLLAVRQDNTYCTCHSIWLGGQPLHCYYDLIQYDYFIQKVIPEFHSTISFHGF